MWALQEWSVSLRASGRAPGTVGRYTYHVRRFAEAHPDPWQVSAADVEARLAACRAPEYKRAVRVALHAWYTWAIRSGMGRHDPTGVLPPVRVPRARARPCPEPVIASGRVHADPDTELMILLACQAGLRRMEVAAVHSDDVDGRWLRVVGKGGSVREVALTGQLQAALARRPPGWVFPGRRKGTHMSPDAVGRRISAALGDGWSAHTLRHRAATRAYEATRDIICVQQQLGHASVATTQRYIASSRDRQLAFAEATG